MTLYIDVFATMYDVREAGNVKPTSDRHRELAGKNVLTACSPDAAGSRLKETSNRMEMSHAVQDVLDRCHTKLREVRPGRPQPHLHAKILTAWNGPMISGFVRAA